jgi:ribose transport system substrate-binding protein
MQRRLFTYIGATALVLTAAACGSDNKASESTAAPTTAAAADTTAATPDTTAPAADTAAPAPAEAIRLAGVYEGLQDPFWTSVTCGAQEEAKARGVELKLYTNAAMDQAKTGANFESALLEKPNGLLLSPVNVNQFVPESQQLMKDGVPIVVSSPTDPRTEYQQVFSDTDTAKFAEQVLSLIPEGAGSMVVLGGAPGIPPLEARTNPFIEAIKKARPDLKPLETVYSFFDPNKVATDLTSLMLANPDLKLVIAAAGPEGFGAASALDKAGKVGQIGLIAFDAVPPEVDALKAGTIQALIAQNPIEIGRQQVGSVVDYLTANPGGGAVPTTAEPIGIPNQLLTAKNLDDPANADYIYKGAC